MKKYSFQIISTVVYLIASGSIFIVEDNLSFIIRFLSMGLLILLIFFLITSKRFLNFLKELKNL